MVLTKLVGHRGLEPRPNALRERRAVQVTLMTRKVAPYCLSPGIEVLADLGEMAGMIGVEPIRSVSETDMQSRYITSQVAVPEGFKPSTQRFKAACVINYARGP
jgi:hypothetical protein